MKAVVYKSTGSWYLVKGDNARFMDARIKGVFKIDDFTSTNPVAVGDHVEIEPEEGPGNTVLITKIAPRQNYINRQSPRLKHHHHIIASNLDQSLLIATLKEPKTSQGFIDRFVVVSEAYHIPSLIVLNKADLYRKKEMERFFEWKEMYEAIGYPVILMSVKEHKGIDELTSKLKDKITLISGHSGVGKSSLINEIIPELQLHTQDVSQWSGKGLHTTTFAEMFDLPFGGKIIDTPGMREFGLVDISKEELSHYFPEMRKLIGQCRYNDCLHLEEPDCAIKKAVAAGSIHENRYISYYNILSSIVKKDY